MNDQSLSNLKIDWKRYEYINYAQNATNSTTVLLRIDLQEDKICDIFFEEV